MLRRRLTAAAAVAVASVSVLVARDFASANNDAAQAKKPATTPQKRTAQMVPFAPGETLTFDVSWSSFLTPGTATLAVKERKSSSGSEAYYIVADRPAHGVDLEVVRPLLQSRYAGGHLLPAAATRLDFQRGR